MLYLRNARGDWHGTKGMWVDTMLHSLCNFQLSPHPWSWHWIFKVKFWKKSYLRNGMADWHGTKGMRVDRMLDSHCDFKLRPHPWPWPWIFNVKYWNCCNSGMGGLTHLEWKGCELDMMFDAQWDWPWAMVHSKKIGQVMGQCETRTVSNLLANEWTIRSLI